MPAYELIVNGVPRPVDVPGETPLLWTLRDALGLTGTKFGCGMGLCGSCTVHVDGLPARSCTLATNAVAGRGITTIEGLSPDASHAVQRAWLELAVVQCGYCQPGQIMAATALLAGNRRPTDTDVDAAMGAHLCRCGTYQRIRRAVHRAAELLAAGSR